MVLKEPHIAQRYVASPARPPIMAAATCSWETTSRSFARSQKAERSITACFSAAEWLSQWAWCATCACIVDGCHPSLTRLIDHHVARSLLILRRNNRGTVPSMEVRTLRATPPIAPEPRLTAAMPSVPSRRRALARSGGRAATGPTRSAPSSSSGTQRLLLGLSRLAAQKVRVQMQLLYTGVLRLLSAWLRMIPLPEWDSPTWDGATADFVEWMFDQGYARTVADWLIPALLWRQPRLHAGGARMFPLTQHAVAGWRRLAPPRSRPPVPWRVLAAAVVTLADALKVQSALLLLLMFETYMRPSEALSLTPMQIIDKDRSQHGTARYVAVIRAEELGQPSKANEFDHTVALDLDRQMALGSWLVAHAQSRAQERGPLWDLGYRALQLDYSWALNQIGASCLGTTLYCVRHRGAFHDRSLRCRTLQEVQQRGAWRSFGSVKRYDKHRRLGLEWRRLPPKTRVKIDRLAQRLHDVCDTFASASSRALLAERRGSSSRCLWAPRTSLRNYGPGGRQYLSGTSPTASASTCSTTTSGTSCAGGPSPGL